VTARLGPRRAKGYRAVMRVLTIAFFAVASLFATACNHDGACQSGPKYGTQCYNNANQNTFTSGSSGPASSNTQPQATPSTPMARTPAR
jgi:hypothetical protein